MKKIAILTLAMVMFASFCLAEAATGSYVIFNTSGEKLTELFLYKNGSEDKGTNHVEELKNDRVTVTYEGDSADILTVEFTTEGRYNAKFEKLHVEEAPISLLSADAMTGATPISFTKPEGTGSYTVYNGTGENLKELYLYPVESESKGENLAADFQDGQVLTYTGPADTQLVLEFTTESGYSGKFEKLHIEVAPITLLSADAMTGATAISFTVPEK